MSKREKYRDIQTKIGTEGNGIVSNTIHSSFRLVDAIKQKSSETILASLTETVSERNIHFTSEEKLVLGHAAKGDRWEIVESQLDEMRSQSDQQRPDEEILESIRMKIN